MTASVMDLFPAISCLFCGKPSDTYLLTPRSVAVQLSFNAMVLVTLSLSLSILSVAAQRKAG